MASRFSKQNIDKLVYVPSPSLFAKVIKEYLGGMIILNVLPILLPFITAFIGLLLNLDIFIFLLIQFNASIIAIGAIYYIYIKFDDFKVKRYKIKIKSLKKPISFIFLSDYHAGVEYFGATKEKTQRVVKAINNLHPDLVIFGGDFITHDLVPERLEDFKNIECKSKIGVLGNHDIYDKVSHNYKKKPTELINFLKTLDIEIFINEGKLFKLNNERIFFGGINDLYSKKFNIDKAFEHCPDNAVRILLAHNPDIIDFIQENDFIDLILSGHNHSGQVYFEPFGIHLPVPGKYQHLTRGLFKVVGKTQLFVSQGIGYSGTRIRVGTESEICYITLVKG